MKVRKTMKALPYWYSGNPDKAADEYNYFRRCLPQLIDDIAMTGDLNGKWVIFRDGWVYGMASYSTDAEAVKWGKLLHKDEASATWIVVQVDLEKHKISPLHLLADALSDLDYTETANRSSAEE